MSRPALIVDTGQSIASSVRETCRGIGGGTVNAPVAAIDTETTGLEVERHEAWDVGIVLEDGSEHQWFIKPELAFANPYSLRVGRFYQRTAGIAEAGSTHWPHWSDPRQAALEIAQLLDGVIPLGHNVPFDTGFIGKLLRRHGQVLTADHHQIDTFTLVTGWIAGRAHADPATYVPEPAGPHLADMARAAGIDPGRYNLHTSLGDAGLAMAVYKQVMAGPQ